MHPLFCIFLLAALLCRHLLHCYAATCCNVMPPPAATLCRHLLQRYAATCDQALRSYPATVSTQSRQPATDGIRSRSKANFAGSSAAAM
jgi:hypothetical protein